MASMKAGSLLRALACLVLQAGVRREWSDGIASRPDDARREPLPQAGMA